jgi:hypothetical protein
MVFGSYVYERWALPPSLRLTGTQPKFGEIGKTDQTSLGSLIIPKKPLRVFAKI